MALNVITKVLLRGNCKETWLQKKKAMTYRLTVTKGRCKAAGFEDGGKGRRPQIGRGAVLETGKVVGTSSP